MYKRQVSGNVSLYNESKATGGGSAILPTPAIGAVGLLDDWGKSATIALKSVGDRLFLVGNWQPHLGQSLWLREIAGQFDGAPPPVDLAAERLTGETIQALITDGIAVAVHDVSDGGIAVAAAEMALAGDLGVMIMPGILSGNFAEQFFSEAQGCYLVEVTGSGAEARARLSTLGVSCVDIGCVDSDVAGRNFEVGDGEEQVSLADLRAAHEGFFPTLMGADAALA